MQQNSSRLFGLDLLRTIAICLVIISHSTLLLFSENSSFILNIIRLFGAIGVDLFFVLSGYLIGGIILNQIESNRTTFSDLLLFWKRRWFRTLPNYFLVLIINILLSIILHTEIVNNGFLYILFLQNFLTPHPDFFTEAWSLSIEEYAYLLLPMLIYCGFFVFRKSNKKRLFLIFTVISIVILFVFKIHYLLTYEVETYKIWSGSFRKVVIYRLDSIYFGFLVIYVSKRFTNWITNFKVQLMILGLSIFLLLHIAIFYFNMLPQTHLFFYSLFYLQFLIFSIGLMFPYFSQIIYAGFWKSFIYFMSTRSYAIYLVNYSMVLLTIQFYFKIEDFSIVQKSAILTGYLMLTVCISELIYRYFERPILSLRDKNYPRK